MVDSRRLERAGVGEEGEAPTRERALRERRAVARQTGADQRDRYAGSSEPDCTRVPGDAVADDGYGVVGGHQSPPSDSTRAIDAGWRAARTAAERGARRSIQRYQAEPPTIAADVA